VIHDKPVVTIGLCVKNVEAVVGCAVKSIVAQDFPNDLMELIVVDGCSKDSTIKIIEDSLSEAKFQCRIFYENKGLGFARQVAVENAKGDYIVWIDGDIIVPEGYLKKQVEFMDQNPSVGIGRAQYGILQDEPIVAFLENISFVVQSTGLKREIPVEIAGTEASIYRREAINQAGGFDIKITGAAEDLELTQRMLNAGWLSCVTPAVFYEKCRTTWKSIWDEYVWWGYGAHYVYHKDRHLIRLYQMTPVSGFIAGLLRLPQAYQLSRRKSVSLLPYHYAFKRIAWCFGFMKGELNGYGHVQNKRVNTSTIRSGNRKILDCCFHGQAFIFAFFG
jgi:glycosyltransferase involved in cell wall biosynthesis